jgi:2-keto-3-deoxy-L-rhamnonate aldolase RhmA
MPANTFKKNILAGTRTCGCWLQLASNSAAEAMARAGGYGTFADYLNTASREIAVTLQLETLTAVARIPQIAKVDGVDGIFIGPADLAASMGLIGRPDHPDVQAQLKAGAGGEGFGREGGLRIEDRSQAGRARSRRSSPTMRWSNTLSLRAPASSASSGRLNMPRPLSPTRMGAR